jgi:hypothetical protein
MIKVATNLLLAIGAGLLWWAGNIQLGNVRALEYLGWVSAYPWYVSWVVAILPSISQLFLTEQWNSKEKGQELDPLSMVFAGFVAIVIDLGGPVLGFFVVTGVKFDMWSLAAAIVIAAFVSILCQHVAWVRGKAAIAALTSAKPARVVQKPTQGSAHKPTRLATKLAQTQHVNGRENAHASPTRDE